MTLVYTGNEQKSFEKNAMKGPNIQSYNNSYDKFQAKSTPMSVPAYNMGDSKWQNTYGRMQANSHPDFKPIYGPQDNKRPYSEMMDMHRQNKEREQKERKEESVKKDKEAKERKEQSEEKARKEKEAKEKKESASKKEQKPPKRGRYFNDEPQETSRKQKHPEDEKPQKQIKGMPLKVKSEDPPIKENETPIKRKNEKPLNERNKQQSQVQYYEPKQRKLLEKTALAGPNIKPYNNDYDRKFPLRSTNVNVPEYKPGDRNSWPKTYNKMSSSSHPDFYPVYGPQNNKRKIDMMDMYREKKEKEKEKPVKEKTEKRLKEEEPKEKDHKQKEEKVPQEKPSKEEKEKQNLQKSQPKEETPRKTPKETPKENPRETPRAPYKDSPRRNENKAGKDSPTQEDDDKYYGYEERPARKDEKREPVTNEVYQSNLKKKTEEPKKDKQKEVKPTPREEKKDVRKEESPERKVEEKSKEKTNTTPRDKKKNPYDYWNKDDDDDEDEVVTPKQEKQDPYDYRRQREQPSLPPPKREIQKEIKATPREEKPSQKENNVKSEKRDPSIYRRNNAPNENTRREVNRVETKKEEPKKPPYNRQQEKKTPATEDNALYTSREHTRPNRTMNNNTSIVRDASNPRQENKLKPTAKVQPTTREMKEEEKKKKAQPERKETRFRDEKSVRARYYETADIDDVLQDKIATQLRDNGIAETKVIPLSAKITQAVRDDVIEVDHTGSPQVTANLTEAINKHMDPIMFNRPNATDLRDKQRPSDANHLSNLVLLRMGQIHEEIDLCKVSLDDPKNKKGKGQTPRDDPPDRSMLMAIKDGIDKQKTEKDILKDKLKQAEKDTHEVEGDKEKRYSELQNLDTENWQLRKDLKNAEQSTQGLLSKLKDHQKNYDHLDKQHQEIRQENIKLKNRLNDTEGQNQSLGNDLAKLQSENARLKVLTAQKDKEILHLRDPDKDMVHQIKILSDEVTMLRTQTRRLNEEKGLLKSRGQKMESNLEESMKQKSKLMAERDKLFKENQDLKQRYRKLALANPQQQTFPDISTGRNGPSSRVPSRNVQNSEDRRMLTAREEEEDDYYVR